MLLLYYLFLIYLNISCVPYHKLYIYVYIVNTVQMTFLFKLTNDFF